MGRIFEKNLIWLPTLLILYNFCANLSNDIYLPSMPKLVQLFNSTPATLQLTMTAWFAGVALPQLFFGPLTDKVGRRPVILGGGIIFIVATLACIATNNMAIFIIARFFQGVGVCSLNVTTFSILIDLYQYKARIQVMNRINMFGTMAPLIGPVIGGYVLTYFSWQANFYIIFAMGLISVIGLWIKLPESNLQLNPQALNVKHVMHNYLMLTKNKNLIRHLIPYCLILGGLVAYLTTAPFIIIKQLNISPSNFGYTQLPVFGMYILGAMLFNRIDNDVFAQKVTQIGFKVVLLSCLLMLCLSYFFGNNLYVFIIPMVLYALGFSFCSAPFVNEVMASAPLIKGSAAAFLGCGMALSCMLCSFVVGMIYNGSIFSIAIVLSSVLILASIFYFLPAFYTHHLTNETN
ncbi:MAG: multidrug effflux MFS transporter [Gammaproteobacteria bacterium]|nr:multidrug effflux MFS transporter [Gammaproteobacteria bacterium]